LLAHNEKVRRIDAAPLVDIYSEVDEFVSEDLLSRLKDIS